MVPDQENGSGPKLGNGVASSDERLPHQQWQGRSTEFMHSNDHSRERAGIWNTEGLEGPALDLVKGDEESGR
jgi:phosphoglucan,water dikinase